MLIDDVRCKKMCIIKAEGVVSLTLFVIKCHQIRKHIIFPFLMWFLLFGILGFLTLNVIDMSAGRTPTGFLHVEMMGFLGAGNNPMVGMTVSVAVAVEEAIKK